MLKLRTRVEEAQSAAEIAAFQRKYGLQATGKLDPATQYVMGAGLAVPKLQAAKTTTTKASTSAAKGRGGGALKWNEALHPRGRGGTFTVKQGDQGAAVQAIQAHVGVASDGQYNQQTEQAIRNFQQQHGLKVDGVVGAQTVAAMQGDANAAQMQEGQMNAGQQSWLLAQAAKTSLGQQAQTQAAKTTAKAATTTTTTKIKASTKSAPLPVRHSAEQPSTPPDLEEATLEFGFGGDPSRSIKDARDQLADYDQPIWDRSGARVEPDLTIEDSRGLDRVVQPPTADLTIPDGRDRVLFLLRQAVRDREAATNGFAFARARAREVALREQLQEFSWSEELHPRGRGGKFSSKGGLKRAFGLVNRKPSAKDHVQLHRDHALMWAEKARRARTPELADAARKAAEFHVAEAHRLEGTSAVLPRIRSGGPTTLYPNQNEVTKASYRLNRGALYPDPLASYRRNP